MTMKHKAATFIIAGFLISICLSTFLGIKDAYNLTETGLQDGENIFQKLNNLNLIQGVNAITDGFLSIVSPDNPLDMLGALATVGVGLLQTIGGIIEFPIAIIGIITNFYSIPGIFSVFIGAMVVCYIGFVILSVITRSDL